MIGSDCRGFVDSAARSVLGREVDDVLYKFTTGMPGRLRVAEGPVKFSAVLVEFDYQTGRAVSASPVYREYKGGEK